MSSETATPRFFLHAMKNPIAIPRSNEVERDGMVHYIQRLIGIQCRAVKVNIDKTTHVSLYNAFLDISASNTYTQVLTDTPLHSNDFYKTLCNDLWNLLDSAKQHATATIYMVDPDYRIVYEVEITLQDNKYTVTTFHPDA